MSLLSRLFRKAPSVPPQAPQPTSSAKADKAAQRARVAATEEQALQSALDARDVQAIARLVVDGTSTKVRQAAAHAIDDLELLRQLIRDVRGGNDNNVYKVLTAKRDALLEQARQREQLQAEIDAVSAALERLSQRAYDVLYSGKLDHFERRWNAVADQAAPELQASVRQWIAQSRATLAEHQRQVEAQVLREQAAAKEAEDARRLREQQAQAAAEAAADVAAEHERMLDEHRRTSSEPLEVGRQPVERQPVHPVAELVRKARAALNGGSTSRAARMRQEIEGKLAEAPPLPPKLASQLQQLDQQLDELKDWKSFSVAPKRTELIEEMESLIGASLDPQALADSIKQVQDEWRTLGKGVGESAEADWQRFQEAAKKAYQPCSEYFAAQALVREENLQRREALMTQLLAFEAGHDWERLDARAVVKALQETKQEWRSVSNVDRAAGKAQQEKFAALTKRLQGRLDAEYARNVKQKEALIESAQALLATEDGRKAIAAIKELQQKWRAVGLVPREVDQRLWGEFRQHCDAVFQKREQDFAVYAAGLESNKAQAVALCEQLDAIAALEGPELLARAASLSESKTAFEALGEFPRADAQALHDRFDQALKRCKAAMVRQRARDAEQVWTDLFEAANHVRAYRFAAAHGADTTQLDALKEATDTYIASVSRWPKRGLDALKQALADESSADLAANEVALKMLCIRAEMQAGLPTPSADQALRRDYQLQRLVQGMGQGLKADEAQLDDMAIEWVRVGPVSAEAYAPLLQRFRDCREQGNARATA